jgi:glycosyltransferase involved in cell wall biosynthesis
MAPVSVKVSVVVPVYNPGAHIQPLVDSLLRQSLDPSEFEAIFVDDGSTDETPALLDRLAAEHAHFHVVHQPNSGWPGKPRNVGMDHAQGEYVFFSDNDDWFGDEALERMYDAAVKHRSDIVIGKMVGHNRGVPRELFRRNRQDATLDNAPLWDSLTPHKLFRRAFLEEHGVRFPEGKRRLEDHVFVMKAYFLAHNIYVLSDYDCYHHIGRADVSNAGYTDIEPVSYYGYVRETVDIVLAHTEPGSTRDRCLRRFLRVEVLSRLDGSRFAATPPDVQQALFDAARSLVVDTMPVSVDEGLPGRQRLVAKLVRDGDLDAVRALARWTVRVGASMTGAAWHDQSVRIWWSASVPSALVARSGDGYALRRGDTVYDLDVTEDLARTQLDLIAADPDRGEVILPTEFSLTVTPEGRLSALGMTTIGFGAGVSDLPAGVWTFRLRLRTLGWVADSVPLPVVPSWTFVDPAIVGEQATLVRTTRTQAAAACVDVGGRARWLDAETVGPARARSTDAGLAVRLPVLVRGAQSLPVRVGDRVVSATLREVRADPPLAELDVAAADVSAGGALAIRAAAGSWLDLAYDVSVSDGRLRASRPPAVQATLLTQAAKRRAVLVGGAVKRVQARGRRRAKKVVRRFT